MDSKMEFYERYTKRLIDIVCALIAIILLSPIFLITAFLVRFKLGSPVIFKQPRPGLNGKIFNLYKFRSMTDERDEFGNLCSDEIRLTKFGERLRATSLDELPELINVLNGSMSLVGPRPLMVEYLDLYSEFQSHRHDVRPGITGLAQVNGRNCLGWEERFELDIQYVTHCSFFLDLKILLLTVKTVFSHTGITSETSATMEDFKGSDFDE